MKAGKHVFTEKLMAHSVAECKEMCRVAREKNKLLAVGHQRHYSVLYDNANFLLQNGVLGDVRHIRALWHRNNALPMVAKDKDKNTIYDPKTGLPEIVNDEKGNIVYQDSWKKPIPDQDQNIDYAKYGYKSLDELIRWRLYNRTGAGLMAELGSHQLDACSIFLGKKHPIAVTGVGGTIFYKDGREVDDHVFTIFEFPYGPGRQGPGGGDLLVDQHQLVRRLRRDGHGLAGHDDRQPGEGDPPLQGGGQRPLSRQTNISIETVGKKPVLETSPSLAGPSAATSLGGLATADPSRGYREELEHFAYCIRHGNASNYHDDKDHQPRAAARSPWPMPSSP